MYGFELALYLRAAHADRFVRWPDASSRSERAPAEPSPRRTTNSLIADRSFGGIFLRGNPMPHAATVPPKWPGSPRRDETARTD